MKIVMSARQNKSDAAVLKAGIEAQSHCTAHYGL